MFSNAMRMGVQASLGLVGDPLYNNVELLINGNTGLVDLSKNQFVIRPTNLTQGLDYTDFNGSSGKADVLGSGAAAPTTFQTTGDFCYEAVLQLDTLAPSFQTVFDMGAADTIFYADHSGASGNPRLYSGLGSGTTDATSNGGIAKHHLAVTKDGTTIRWFIDGVLSGTGTHTTSTAAAAGLILGAQGGASNWLDGKIYALRITQGDPRYTAAFTPDLLDDHFFPVGPALLQTGVQFTASSGYTVSTTVSTNDTTLRNSSTSWAFGSLLDVAMTTGKYVATFKCLAKSGANRANFGVADGASTTNFLANNSAGEGGADTQGSYKTYSVGDEITVMFDADNKIVTVVHDDMGMRDTARQAVTGSTHYFCFQEYDSGGQVQLIDNGRDYPGYTKLVP